MGESLIAAGASQRSCRAGRRLPTAKTTPAISPYFWPESCDSPAQLLAGPGVKIDLARRRPPHRATFTHTKTPRRRPTPQAKAGDAWRPYRRASIHRVPVRELGLIPLQNLFHRRGAEDAEKDQSELLPLRPLRPLRLAVRLLP